LKSRERGIVIAPHAFYPIGSSLREQMDCHADLFDAVEYNAMFTSLLNFNTRAAQWAHEHGKPVVGNGDIHRLRQLGSTYSLVEAEPEPDAICEAIRDMRVDVHAQPLSIATAAAIMSQLLAGDLARGRLRQVLAGHS
jgi:predicted metal-dependent phosphoesterase TrpH